jgi:hypothetical protein
MVTRKTYQELVKFYQDCWLKTAWTHAYDADKALSLLKTYTHELGAPHSKVVLQFISPYLDKKSHQIIVDGTRNLSRILYQISLLIPEYNPEGGLAAVFEVIEKKTGIDIHIYRGNDEIAKLRMAMNAQDSLTMQDLLQNKEIDVCKEYSFIADREPMTPLHYLLYVGIVHPASTIYFIKQGIDMMVAINHNCLNALTIERFEALKNTPNLTWDGVYLYNKISGYLRKTNCLNNIIQFIICCNDNSDLNTLNILPKELVAEICVLTIQLSTQEGNSSLNWIKLLVNAYLIRNAGTNEAEEIKGLVEWYENIPVTQHPGTFLYFLSTVLTSDRKPGFHNKLPGDFLITLQKIAILTQIDITAFYQDGALTKFFSTHRARVQSGDVNCMIEMILQYGEDFPNAAEDIKLIFAHSNCFALGKKGLIQSLMECHVEHKDAYNIVKQCGKLAATTHKELLESFEFALKMHRHNDNIHWATYLFCLANNLNTPSKYIESHHHSQRLSILIQILTEIHDQVTMMKGDRCEKKIVSSELIMMLLSHTQKPGALADHGLRYVADTYLLLLKVKDNLANWETVMETFTQKHIHDMSRVIRLMIGRSEYKHILDKDSLYRLMCMTTQRNFTFFSHNHDLPHDQVERNEVSHSLPTISNPGF